MSLKNLVVAHNFLTPHSLEPLDKDVLLATYPAFTTGADLLQELKAIYKRVPPGHDDALLVQPR